MSLAALGRQAAPETIPECPFPPYAYYEDLSAEALDRYFRGALERTRARPGVRRWTLGRRGLALGLVELEPLEFDSRALVRPAARLNWLLAAGDYLAAVERKGQLLDWALEEARRRGIEHLTSRAAADDLSSLHALQSRGFEILDGMATFSRAPAPAPEPEANGWRARAAGAADLAELRRIAESSFRHDRYHADPAIESRLADRLHGEWVENSLRGFADAVLVVEDQDGLAGFTTLKIDPEAERWLGISIASIVLVATRGGKRGRGAGRRLTGAALDWCRQHHIARVEVGTQWSNGAACRLYASAGFRFAHASVSLRWIGSAKSEQRP